MDMLRSTLRVALVADALDAIGVTDRCLGADLSLLTPGSVVVGRALPFTLSRPETVPETRYVGLLQALDAVGPDDVVVISSERSELAAIWGELLSTIAKTRGAAGAVCAGLVRDARAIRELGFPVVAAGTIPYDIHGRFEVVACGETIVVDGVPVAKGDLVVADDDGVVVVGADLESAVLDAALSKSGKEDLFRDAVAQGMLPSEAYRRFRVL
jgi:regulator of RNase E activity RraA